MLLGFATAYVTCAHCIISASSVHTGVNKSNICSAGRIVIYTDVLCKSELTITIGPSIARPIGHQATYHYNESDFDLMRRVRVRVSRVRARVRVRVPF